MRCLLPTVPWVVFWDLCGGCVGGGSVGGLMLAGLCLMCCRWVCCVCVSQPSRCGSSVEFCPMLGCLECIQGIGYGLCVSWAIQC